VPGGRRRERVALVHGGGGPVAGLGHGGVESGGARQGKTGGPAHGPIW
jgi:hypothetical protein